MAETVKVELERVEVEALLPENGIPAGTSQAIEARRKLRAALNSDTDGGTDG